MLQAAGGFLGGPWNSLDRVYGGVSLHNGADAEMLIVYTWREGYGWTEFHDTNTVAWGIADVQAWVVMAQTGYALTSGMTYKQPLYVRSGIGEVNEGPGVDIFWITYVP